MADDIIFSPKGDSHETENGEGERLFLDDMADVNVHQKQEKPDQDGNVLPNASLDDDHHGMTDVVAAIDAFLAEPHAEDDHNEAQAEAQAEIAADTVEHAVASGLEKHSEEVAEEKEKHNDAEPATLADAEDLSAAAPEVETTDLPLENDEAADAEHSHLDSHLENDTHREDQHYAASEGTEEDKDCEHIDHEEHEDTEALEEHPDNSDADMSISESVAAPDAAESNPDLHDEDTVQDTHEEHAEHTENNGHDAMCRSLDQDDEARRVSLTSSRSSTSTRRTSLRTEALIQAAARAVVAKINGHDAAESDFDILTAISDSHNQQDQQADATDDTDHRTTTDEEDENDHDGDIDDDDVFSDRSPRSSLGSFEHNSSASNDGDDDGQQKKNTAADNMTFAMESESHYDDYDAEAGNAHYHEHHQSPRMSTMSGMSSDSRGPRISDVTGISHMSQYVRNHDNSNDGDDYNYGDGEDYIPHTIRGTPRAAFRTPSSVRAIQMTSPSPSVIFGVSPRSAARRRRLGTGDGVDEGQSLGSVRTYSSLPGSPSKKSTPTRFKAFHRPEPAPLVLLHATLMPTRWIWSDVIRGLDESMSSASSKATARPSSAIGGDTASGNGDSSSAGKFPADISSFVPSAALRRLHSAWCQLQDYSLGTDTVAERGVLLPHPQNDYEVLEERLLEALELPVRRRARILECGHYLGPSDVDDEEDEEEDEDDDYGGGDNNERGDGNSASPNKRHWCTTCRSDIRYESLGAERVFRVKVYASNGLMTVGAWDACWREMERVDVEIEPIVSDSALLRELNHLRILQQQEALRKQEEEHEHEMLVEYEEHEEHDGGEEVGMHSEDEDNHQEHLDVEEHQLSPALVDHFHLTPSASTSVSPPLRDSPVEPPATTTTDHSPASERRRREAEERLREIYGQTPPPSAPTTIASSSHIEATSAMPMTAETEAMRSMDNSAFGPSPPSPSAEAYERREERRHQYSSSSRETYQRAPAHTTSFSQGSHVQQPYESASLPELIIAAVRVFLRDRKHVAITVLSVIVILLATMRSPATGIDGPSVATVPVSDSVTPKVDVHNVIDNLAASSVAPTATTIASSVLDEIVASTVAKIDTQVETVVEKMTVKVYETVTETATETATTITTTTSLEIATAATVETATVDNSIIEPTSTAVSTATGTTTEAAFEGEVEETTDATDFTPCPMASLFAEPTSAAIAEPTSAAKSGHALFNNVHHNEL